MSFYSYKNEGNTQCPGRISEEGYKKACEKVCIQVNKVYDSCLQQETLTDERIELRDIEGGPFTQPLQFVSAKSITTKGILKNTEIERLPERPCFARVRTCVLVPLKVTFEDATGKIGTGKSKIAVHKDVVFYVPEESVIPFELESVVSAISVVGEQTRCECLAFIIDLCINIILKIVAKVELLIPAFGYCDIPPCEEYASNVCDTFFGLPLFPQDNDACDSE